jgi:replicative DNA helicase
MNNAAPQLKVLESRRLAFNNSNDASEADLANIAAESALIGALVQTPKDLPIACDYVSQDDFHDPLNAMAFYAMTQFENHVEIDEVTLAQKITEKSYRDFKMTKQEIVDALVLKRATFPREENLESYALAVRNAAQRIRTYRAGLAIVKDARNPKVTPDELASRANQVVQDATNQLDIKQHDASSHLDAFLAHMDAGGSPPIMTGYDDFDYQFGGLIPGNLNLLVGFTGAGKTTFALSILHNISLRLAFEGSDKRCVLFSYEMSATHDIIPNLISMSSGVWRSKLREPKRLTDIDHAKLKEATAAIRAWGSNLHIYDDPELNTPERIRMKLRRVLIDTPIELVVIDGLWLMQGVREDYSKMHEIVLQLHTIAQSMNIPILLLHQFNNAASNAKKPDENILEGTSRATNTPERIWCLWRAGDGVNTHLYELKFRGGNKQVEPHEFWYDRDRARYDERPVYKKPEFNDVQF